MSKKRNFVSFKSGVVKFFALSILGINGTSRSNCCQVRGHDVYTFRSKGKETTPLQTEGDESRRLSDSL